MAMVKKFQAVTEGITSFLVDSKTSMFQLIEENGTFKGSELNTFTKEMKLEEIGLDYAVVSVIGQQSSGKSTILNHLFKTDFKEMKASDQPGSQTTQGIWLAKASDNKTCVLVFDIEGSDGQERGEDGTLFQNQSAIFALTVSNVVIINIWSIDIGLIRGWTHLLKIIFKQTITLKMQSRTTLLFLVRDKSPTMRLNSLKQQLQKQIEKIWNTSVLKTEGQEDASLDMFFDVQIRSLPHFEHSRESFKEEVSYLRDDLYNLYLPRIVREQKDRIPAAAFSCKAQTSWEIIKQNNDLDIPSLEKLVSTHRCRELKKEIAKNFSETKDWKHLKKDVAYCLVPDFGQKLSSVIQKSLLDYDQKAAYYDELVRNETRLELIDDLAKLECTRRLIDSMHEYLYVKAAEEFKRNFERVHNNQIGESFDAAAEDCKRDVTLSFDRRCEEMENDYTKYNLTNLHGRLNRDIGHCITVFSLQIALAHSKAAHLDAARAAEEARVTADEAEAEAAEAAEAVHTALQTRYDSSVALQRAADTRVTADLASQRARYLNDMAEEAAAAEARDEETLMQWLEKMVRMGFSFILSVFGIVAAAVLNRGGTGATSVSTTTIINPVYNNIVQVHSDMQGRS